ncbi:sulfite exporter TauE/SafE family protein [Metallosphaera hakonensis]|uniref:Probable membrane transporter protein n=1 Tax=Metallosphaera hakonensis JCM 8857 = DSM 7519 TaxID=1293036 RepID=A0A2U9IRK0_9CREN|nr:sulfite exporter TauE/SafE family protein [Metallosphaera hakonensis]AWR98603.1 TSUP family transporter [Metallosphaera hakonensis JCM 8857 = DSM 7519]
MDLILALIVIGIAVGALTGITGSSGVLIVVPALSYLGLSFVDSVGTSLWVDIITTISVILVYFRHGNVDLKVSLILGVGAILGAQIGSRIAFVTPDRVLEVIFTLFTTYMAYVSFRRSRNPKLNIRKVNIGTLSYAFAPLLSILIGVVTGTLGASGGIMFIAVMMLLFSMDVKRMIGTATLAMLLSALSGGVAYSMAGRVDVLGSVVIGVSALISGFFFARLANTMRPSIIYAFLGSVFVITSLSEAIKVI